VTVSGGWVTEIAPNPAHPYSKGAFCIKGIRGTTGIAYHEKRLLYPLKRAGERGSGQWKRVSWDEALDEAADRLAEVRAKYGPLSLAGAVSNANTNRGVTIPLLLRSLGSPNVLINQDLCGGCRGVSGRVTGLDITRGEDIEHARCALVVGRNSYAADPCEWMKLKELKKRGGRIVVLDPKRTPVTEMADLWLRPRPGTDAAIGLAMMNVLIAEGLFDRAFVERWCHGFDALRERIAPFTPEMAERHTGVSAADIVAATRLYADGPSVFVSGHGIDAFSRGVQTFRAFHCLVAISGNVDRLGGNRRTKRPHGFRDYLQVVHDPAFRLPREIEEQRIGANKFPLWSGPEGWQAACHNPSVMEAILTGRPYPVRAMYVSGVNPVVTYPNTPRTVEAFKSLDFLMVATDMMTPTAELADIVLPKTTGIEEEDVKLAHSAGAVTYCYPVVPPLGEARGDLEIAIALLDRMAARNAVTKNLFRWRTAREFVEFLLGDSGITVEQLRETGFAHFDFTLGNFAERPFPTKTGKVELFSERLASLGLDPLPNYIAPSADSASADACERFPLLLLTGDREKTYHHSRFREQNWAKKVSPHPRLLVHPETASAHALADDQWVRVETHNGPGSCRLKVKITDGTPKGVVSTGMGWWLPEAEGPDHGAYDININAAMTYDGPWDPMSGSVDTRGLRCRVVPAQAV
jgi:anaerobic selenocysteine-containing dehydrogenase